MNSILQGSSPILQGSAPTLQGSSPNLQPAGGNLQVTANPMQPNLSLATTPTTAPSPAPDPLAAAEQKYGNTQQQLMALLAKINQKPIAPTLDYNAIRASSQTAAANTVNPLYDKKINEYLQNEAAAKLEAEQQAKLTTQNAQQALANTTATNAIATDTATKKNELTINNTNAQESNYQTNQGNSFDMKRQALATNIGQSGLTGSGIGNQQLWEAENLRHVEEAQKEGQFKYTKDIANLEKSNTFAQIAESNLYAGQVEQGKESQAKFDLNSYLRQAAYNESQFREDTEKTQLQDTNSVASNITQKAVADFINSFSKDPDKYYAAMQAYGGLM